MDKLASDALFLAIASILSYFYVYCFDIGYCFHFGFPSTIFPITISTIMHTWFFLTLYIILVFGFLQINLQYWPATQKHVVAFVFVFFAYLFLLLTVLAFSRNLMIMGNFNISILLALLLPSAIGFYAVYIYNRDVAWKIIQDGEDGSERTDREKVKSMFTVFDHASNVPVGSIGHVILARLGVDPLMIIAVFLVFVPGISLYAGWAKAYSQTVFYIYERTSDHGNQVVLKISEGQLISAPYDPIHETYKGRFVVVNVTDPIIGGLVETHVEKLKYEVFNNKK